VSLSRTVVVASSEVIEASSVYDASVRY